MKKQTRNILIGIFLIALVGLGAYFTGIFQFSIYKLDIEAARCSITSGKWTYAPLNRWKDAHFEGIPEVQCTTPTRDRIQLDNFLRDGYLISFFDSPESREIYAMVITEYPEVWKDTVTDTNWYVVYDQYDYCKFEGKVIDRDLGRVWEGSREGNVTSRDGKVACELRTTETTYVKTRIVGGKEIPVDAERCILDGTITYGVREKVPEIIDTDEDGIPDEEDACPTEFGFSEYSGCPEPIPIVPELYCGDGICSAEINETYTNCPEDCLLIPGIPIVPPEVPPEVPAPPLIDLSNPFVLGLIIVLGFSIFGIIASFILRRK